jgi:hypothetical protein
VVPFPIEQIARLEIPGPGAVWAAQTSIIRSRHLL